MRATPAGFLISVFALVFGLAVVAGPLRASTAVAAAPSLDVASYGALARLGVGEVGRYGGECYEWMKRVVREATGISIGPDYRLGYLQAGAVEVPLADARHGDIVQLADDRNTVPWADYPGLHTAIVLDNLGGGKFRVVDSNSRFDGVVRVREWDPQMSASRYSNISVHVYRLPDSPLPPGSVPKTPARAATPTTPAVPLAPGVTAVIVADGDCLRVRSAAGLVGNVLGCLAEGSRVTVTEVGTERDGYRWTRVSAGAISGWVADRYLRGIAAAGAASPAQVAGARDEPAAEAPKPPSTEGKIVGGAVPAKGFGLLVYGGGTSEQLVEATECARERLAFWAAVEGGFVPYVPGTTVGAVNAKWNAKFNGSIPAGTALIGRCDAGTAPLPAAPAPPAERAAEPDAEPAAAEESAPPEEAAAPAPEEAPAPEPEASTPPSEEPAAPRTYAVEEGDTLSGIASRFRPEDAGVWEYMERLRELNGLAEDEVLSIGQELRLP